MYLFSVSKNGVSAKEVQRHLGISYESAHRMCKQIRSAMSQGGMKLSGVVEADETYFGSRKWNKGYKYNADRKIPILGVVERKGRIKAVVTDVASTVRTKAFLRGNLELGSVLHTDESPLYDWTKTDYYRYAVKHSAGEYVRGNVHTNTIEGFWGNWKKAISGTYHHVSKAYLPLYLDEFVWLYNHRDVAVYPALLEQASKRVL